MRHQTPSTAATQDIKDGVDDLTYVHALADDRLQWNGGMSGTRTLQLLIAYVSWIGTSTHDSLSLETLESYFILFIYPLTTLSC